MVRRLCSATAMTRAAIKHGEEQLRLAMLASDVETLETLCHEALLFHTPEGVLLRKEDDLENHRSGRQKLTKLQTSELVVELHGADLAVTTLRVDLEGTFDEQAFGGQFRAIRTWRRDHDGPWQIIAGAITRTGCVPMRSHRS